MDIEQAATNSLENGDAPESEQTQSGMSFILYSFTCYKTKTWALIKILITSTSE